MHKEKILHFIVTKDGISLALQVSYLKFELRSRIFLTMGSIFSLFITSIHLYDSQLEKTCHSSISPISQRWLIGQENSKTVSPSYS